MSFNVKVQYKINSGWTDEPMDVISDGLRQMSTAVRSQAVLNAPIKTGALRKSAAIDKQSDTSYLVGFGGTLKPFDYSLIRERVNNLHPSTKYYLQRAGESVARKYSAYFTTL